jgi:adenylosuccinate lyase
MRANLDASGGLLFSQRVLLALVDAGLGRDEAYRLVQRNAMRAQDEGIAFRTLVEADPEIASVLGADALRRAFDLDDMLRHTGTIVDRLAELETTTKEPAHV